MTRSLKVRLVVAAAVVAAGAFGVAYATAAVTGGGSGGTVVNCGGGKSLQQAINKSSLTKPLVLTIQGTCNEDITINRDDVTLQAGSAGSGITSDGTGPALQVGARDVSLQGLTLAGSEGALVANSGASIQANDDHIKGDVGTSDNANVYLVNVTIDHCQGVGALGGATIFISGGSITGCGVSAAVGGSAFLRDGVSITGAQLVGVRASNGGSIAIDGATISTDGNWGVVADGGSVDVNGDTTVVSGSTFAGVVAENGGTAVVQNGAQVSGNAEGVAAGPGGHLEINTDADGAGPPIIENNTGAGVRLVGASSLQISQAVVQDNGGDGISLSDTSVAVFDIGANGATVTGNTGWGVQCDGPPSVAVERGPTAGVTGNTAGNVDCQNAGQPG